MKQFFGVVQFLNFRKWYNFNLVNILKNMFRAISKDHEAIHNYQLRHCTSEKKISTTMPQLFVGNYRYCESNIIGKGFSSKVYKAFHKSRANQIYAIKVIDTSKFKASSLQMLDAEIEIHKSLNHPNVVQCYESFKIGSFCYIITQYCQSGDLMKLISEKRKLEEKKVVEILKQILNGCKYLLEEGILHRDLKPANIFKKGTLWKIGDFGFAIRQKNEIKDRINVGTPLYMPLEALTKNRYSPKSDIFAIGVIAFQIYFGKTPWQSSTQKQLIKKMSKFKIQFPRNIENRSLKDLILKACENEDEKRMSKQQFLSWNIKIQDNPQELFHQSQSASKNYTKNYGFTSNHDNLEKKMDRGLISKFDYLRKQQQIKQNVENLNPTIKKHAFIPKQRSYDLSKINSPRYRPVSEQVGLNQNKNQSTTTAQDTPQSIKFIPKIPSIEQITKIGNSSSKYKPKVGSLKVSNVKLQSNISFDTNKEILLQRLNFCRFLFYFIKNISCLIIPAIPHRENLKMILFKHLLKNIKQLEDRKNNMFNMLDWDTFINTEAYAKLNIQFKEYSLRYERQYLDYLKSVDVSTIRSVNKYFPELSQTQTGEDRKFFGSLEKYLKQLLKNCNHQMVLLKLWDKILGQYPSENQGYGCKIIDSCNNNLSELGITNSMKAEMKHFEAINSLLAYLQYARFYKQAKQYSSQFILKIHRKLDISVSIDYENSKLSIQQIGKLRQLIKTFQ